jgi:hypothetical protein
MFHQKIKRLFPPNDITDVSNIIRENCKNFSKEVTDDDWSRTDFSSLARCHVITTEATDGRKT